MPGFGTCPCPPLRSHPIKIKNGRGRGPRVLDRGPGSLGQPQHHGVLSQGIRLGIQEGPLATTSAGCSAPDAPRGEAAEPGPVSLSRPSAARPGSALAALGSRRGPQPGWHTAPMSPTSRFPARGPPSPAPTPPPTAPRRPRPPPDSGATCRPAVRAGRPSCPRVCGTALHALRALLLELGSSAGKGGSVSITEAQTAPGRLVPSPTFMAKDKGHAALCALSTQSALQELLLER